MTELSRQEGGRPAGAGRHECARQGHGRGEEEESETSEEAQGAGRHCRC